MPPMLLMVLAAGLLVYRAGVADWHWEWPKVEGAPKTAVVAPKPAPKADAPVDAKPAVPAVAEPKAAEKGPLLALNAPAKPADPDAKKKALDDIQKEADRIRAEREELAKIKEREGEKLATAPRPPGIGHGGNRAMVARQRAQMQAMMRAGMAEHDRRVREMMRDQRAFLARNGFGGNAGREFDEIDRAFARLERELNALERDAGDVFGRPNGDLAAWGLGRALPPLPGIDADGEEDGDDPDEAGPNQPRVRRFEFRDQSGNIVRGFEIRSGFSR